MATYKLTYFDTRGRAELARYMFVVAGQPFEDNIIKREDWPALKPSMPFAQVPVLDADGKVLAQSNAIARYLAREFNLMGKNSWEHALCDQYLELEEDLFCQVRDTYIRQKDPAKKLEMDKNLKAYVYPKFLAFFEKALKNNGGEYLVGDSLTLADMAAYYGFDTPSIGNEKLMDAYPRMKAHRSKIGAIPNIAEYVQKRAPLFI